MHLQSQLILQLASWVDAEAFKVNEGFTLKGLSVYHTETKPVELIFTPADKLHVPTSHTASEPTPGGGVGGLGMQGSERLMLQWEKQSSATHMRKQ